MVVAGDDTADVVVVDVMIRKDVSLSFSRHSENNLRSPHSQQHSLVSIFVHLITSIEAIPLSLFSVQQYFSLSLSL